MFWFKLQRPKAIFQQSVERRNCRASASFSLWPCKIHSAALTGREKKNISMAAFDVHNGLMSVFDREFGRKKSYSCTLMWPRSFLLSQLMTATFSMQIILVFTDLPWVYIFPPAGIQCLMMRRRWDQIFLTLMLMSPSCRARSDLPTVSVAPLATQCFRLSHPAW